MVLWRPHGPALELSRRFRGTLHSTRTAKPPAGPGWVHEIKHDGYHLIVRRDGENARLFTCRGYDRTERYPAIAGAAAKLRARSLTIDGEAAGIGGMASPSLMACTAGGGASARRSCTHSIFRSSMARTCGPGPSASARRGCQVCWRGSRSGSSTTSTRTKTAVKARPE
jgi:hypothetical protein